MIKIVWLIFTILFSALAVFHFYKSTKNIRRLSKIRGIKSISGISTGLVEMQNDLNQYVDDLNNENKRANIATGLGYTITALTAFFSYFL